jgi:hypothetical protein
MKRLMAVGCVCLMTAGATLAASDRMPLEIASGVQIGVINLLDPELMHFHAGKKADESFMKFQAVTWQVDDMLNAALKDPLGQKGLTLVPLAPSDALVRSREHCFVNAALVKGLPADCSSPLVQLAADAGVNLLIVMAPGLNNSDHTGSSHNDGVSETLRGWGFLTRGIAGAKDKPTLFSDTELLLVGITPQGATVRARQWGGNYQLKWQNYVPPTDPKAIPPEQFNELQPLFASMLSRQGQELLAQVRVSR